MVPSQEKTCQKEPSPPMMANYLALTGKHFMWSIELAILDTNTLSCFFKDLAFLYPPKQFSSPQYNTMGIYSPLCSGEAAPEYHRVHCRPSAGRPGWATPPSLIDNLYKIFRHGGYGIKHLLTKGMAYHFNIFMQNNKLYLLSLVGNLSPYLGVVMEGQKIPYTP